MKKGSIHINTAAHGPKGSALILVVVLTVLLAAVGVLFLMTSRIDEMASSNIPRTRELRAGVNVVLDRIRTVLTDDLFGGDDFLLDGSGTDEYWDYPGDDDPWLASLEPAVNPSDPCVYWPHITDLYDDNFDVDPGYYDVFGQQVTAHNMIVGIIGENDSIDYVENTSLPDIPWGNPADADGDGVADSRWIALPDITSSGGEDIYAAVRIIDNCGMININTAYKFDPLSTDGSQLTDIDLKGITKEGSDPPTDPERDIAVDLLHDIRCGGDGTDVGTDMITYNNEVVWRILNFVPGYLPFDIGDELELRNRFFLDSKVFIRPEIYWLQTFLPGYPNQRFIPYDNVSELGIWSQKSSDGSSGYYNRRHISTTYSFDRVIAPWTDLSVINMPTDLENAWNSWTNWNQSQDQWTYRPVSINDTTDLNLLAAAIWLGLPDDTTISGAAVLNSIPQFIGLGWTDSEIRERLACQMAVNLVDAIDSDPNVTEFHPPGSSDYYYGYESGAEHLNISMVAVAQYDNGIDPCEIHYAIELYNPGPMSVELKNWSLEINGNPFALLSTTIPAKDSFLITDEDDATRGFPEDDQEDSFFSFAAGDSIELRWVGPGTPYTNDIIYQIGNFPLHSGAGELEKYPLYRGQNVLDEANSNLPIWPNPLVLDWPNPPIPVLGTNALPEFLSSGVTMMTGPIQTTVMNSYLRTLGEFTNVLTLGTMNIGGTVYTMPQFWENIRTSGGGDITDITAGRIDLQDDRFADIFRYLTIFNPFSDSVDNDGNGRNDDPANDGVDNDGDGWVDALDPEGNETFANYGEYTELAVAGRININTAPWFVIAQLPWMQYFTGTNPMIPITDNYQRAQAVFNDRIANGPFENIGALMRVVEMRSLAGDIDNNLNSSPTPGPDFTDDAVDDDFEERDILFHRVSNLVTVRSDVFTAYILVRIGQNGPQKRMIAVFDRSGVFSPADRPKLVVLHPVPDPR